MGYSILQLPIMLSVILKRIESWYRLWIQPEKDVSHQIQIKGFDESTKDETFNIAEIKNVVRSLKVSQTHFDEKFELIHERLLKMEQNIQDSLILKTNK